MKISAIIPTYNRPEKTLQALQSVLNQSHPVNEVLIVDDHSTPPFSIKNYTSVQKSSPPIRVIHHEKNTGVSQARNTGILNAQYDWLAFLDSDDEWHADKIHQQIQDHIKNPKDLIFYTDELWMRNGKEVSKQKHQLKHSGWVFKECVKNCFIGASTLLLHKSVLEDVGLFDSSLTVCEDYDLWLRLSLKYPVILNTNKLITKYGGHEDQLSTQFFAMDRYRLKALSKILSYKHLEPESRDLAQTAFEAKWKILHKGAIKHNNQNLLLELKNLKSKQLSSF